MECSGLVWCSKCSILEVLQKAKLHSPETFETSKYQNLPISAFYKTLSYCTFLIFWVRQKKITIYRLFASPSMSCVSVHGSLDDDTYCGNIPNVWASAGLAVRSISEPLKRSVSHFKECSCRVNIISTFKDKYSRKDIS